MAYLLYITRPPHFASRTRRRITAEAWEFVLKGDAALEPVEPAAREPALAVRYAGTEGDPSALLFFKEGNIVCRNPDEATVDKMVALADRLDALVQGEDGELYSAGAELPYLIQFALFDRISRRLRVRFPTVQPPRAHRELPVLILPPPQFLEPPSAAMPRRKMPIGFPSVDRKPSAALQALLNPLRPIA